MSAQKITRIIAIAAASLVVLAPVPSIGVAAVSAAPRKGNLHLTKECSEYNYAAGDFCTITLSNVAEIGVDSKIFYDQPADTPKGLLDSNVVLDAGNGNRAVGRCTLDLATNLGLCTFSDGTGQLAGFQARADVTCADDGIVCDLDGTYSFGQKPDKDR